MFNLEKSRIEIALKSFFASRTRFSNSQIHLPFIFIFHIYESIHTPTTIIHQNRSNIGEPLVNLCLFAYNFPIASTIFTHFCIHTLNISKTSVLFTSPTFTFAHKNPSNLFLIGYSHTTCQLITCTFFKCIKVFFHVDSTIKYSQELLANTQFILGLLR